MYLLYQNFFIQVILHFFIPFPLILILLLFINQFQVKIFFQLFPQLKNQQLLTTIILIFIMATLQPSFLNITLFHGFKHHLIKIILLIFCIRRFIINQQSLALINQFFILTFSLNLSLMEHLIYLNFNLGYIKVLVYQVNFLSFFNILLFSFFHYFQFSLLLFYNHFKMLQ